MSFWWFEAPTPIGAVPGLAVEPVWQSASERVQVLRHARFGRLLVVDGILVHAEAESSAREMLIHPALCAPTRTARRVLLLGGGDGFVLAELLRHPEIEEVLVVEPNVEVHEAAHPLGFTEIFKDPRVRLQMGSLDLEGAVVGHDLDVIVPADVSLSRPGGVLPTLSLLRELLRPDGLLVDTDGLVLTPSGARWLRSFWELGARWSDVAGAYAPARATFLVSSPLLVGQFQAIRLHGISDEPLHRPSRPYHGHYYHPQLHTAATVLPSCFGALQ